jgi:cytochrome c-type biogenesis protein CcmH
MVARYGEFILFRPRMNWRNAWLWSTPAVLMLIGLGIGVRVLRKRTRGVGPDEPGADNESLDA